MKIFNNVNQKNMVIAMKKEANKNLPHVIQRSVHVAEYQMADSARKKPYYSWGAYRLTKVRLKNLTIGGRYNF